MFANDDKTRIKMLKTFVLSIYPNAYGFRRGRPGVKPCAFIDMRSGNLLGEAETMILAWQDAVNKLPRKTYS